MSFDQQTATGFSDIWVVGPYSGQTRQLTNHADHEQGAVFSPNGQQLVYLRMMPFGSTQVRRVNVDGNNDTLLWERTGVVVQPLRWAPNGPRVYLSLNAAGLDSLYSIDAVGSQRGLVTPIAQLPPGPKNFDPPRGSGRWAWEFDWRPLGCEGVGGPFNYRRLALRDTPTDPSDETVFGRPTSTFTSPRWSWDGTRVAYGLSQPPQGVPANISVAQISYNQAPSFVDLGDATLTFGIPFEMELNATDPDGETLTYEVPAAFLPPGASFDPSTRRFTWPAPGPLNAEYFVVFRALDPSGTVAHRVIRFGVGSGGGGCPFADTRTASGWGEENSVLARSLTGALALDVYRLKLAPAVQAGRVPVRLRENEQEYTTRDRGRLVGVDHAPDGRAYAVGVRMFLGTRAPAYRVTTSRGRDVTALVSGSGGYYQGSHGDTLMVEMTAPRTSGTFGATGTEDGGGGEGGLEGDPKEMEVVYDLRSRPASPMSAGAVDAAVLASTGILVEVPDGSGGWRTLTHYYPRRYRDESVVDSLGSGPCRLIFVGRHRLHFVGRYLRSATPAVPQTLDLIAAQHSRLGDTKGAVLRSGGTVATLVPGDTLTLEFAAPAVPQGQVRDYFLLSTGVYAATAPLAQGQPGGSPASARPTRFALAQNQPNPFERTTTIRFELPRETTARLEVFDLQGRRVAVLADGPLPTGYHAVDWDRRDFQGVRVRPGVYLYRLAAGTFRDQKKMVLLGR